MVRYSLGFAIAIWTGYFLYGVTYPIHQAPRISVSLARLIWSHLHGIQGRTRQRLFHTSRVAHNGSNPACRLPEELLNLIFDFVRSSGRFGEGLVDLIHRINNTFNIVTKVIPPAYVGDLYVCALVCRAWSAPAARVLWQHVTLRKREDVVAFSTSATTLSDCVRRIDLPFILREQQRTNMPRARRMLYDVLRPIHFAPEYPEILTRYQNLRTLSIMTSHAHKPIVEMLDATTQENLRELYIIGSESYTQLAAGLYAPGGPAAFGSLVTLHLQNVANYRPDVVQMTTPNLRCFSLEMSTVTFPWLDAVLRSARKLRALELCDVTIRSGNPGVLQWILDCTPYTLLERLVVCGIELKHLLPDPGGLRDMSDWMALKSLTFDNRLAIPGPPPNLEHLTLVYRTGLNLPRDHRSVITNIANIKRDVERIRADAPYLRVVDLWHPVYAGQEWRIWQVAAFLLRDSVSRLGIELNINLV